MSLRRAAPARARALERLRRDGDGLVVHQLKRPFRDGATEFLFEPLDFVTRLAALVPRPRSHVTHPNQWPQKRTLIAHPPMAGSGRTRASGRSDCGDAAFSGSPQPGPAISGPTDGPVGAKPITPDRTFTVPAPTLGTCPRTAESDQSNPVITCAWILPSTGPSPNLDAMALWARSVTSSNRAASRSSISLRKGVPWQ